MNASQNTNPNIINVINIDSFVTLHYKLYQKINKAEIEEEIIVDTFSQSPVTLTLQQGQLSPILEEKLIGLTEGDQKLFIIDNAFGLHNPELIMRFAQDELDFCGIEEGLAIGDLVRFDFEKLPEQKIQKKIIDKEMPSNMPKVAGARLIQKNDDFLSFDFNHPLAGQTFYFQVEILSVL